MKLYEVNEQIEDCLARAIDEETGEIIDSEALAEIEGLELKREVKLFNCAALIKNLKAEAQSLKEHKQEIDAKIKARENRMASIKKYMDISEGSKFKDEFHTIYTQKTSSVTVKVAPKDLPEKYQKVTIEAKKKDIAADINRGVDLFSIAEIVPGFATVIR